jgi:hypothetical protein
MKKILIACLTILLSLPALAQVTGSITVGGDFDKFYPTVWHDGGWNNNMTSELEIGRSNIHTNSNERGAVISKFKYHTNTWGNGSEFIDADIVQVHNKFDQNVDFIAGWQDVSRVNSNNNIVIWLRGGGTTYYYKSNYGCNPMVFDGVANPLPFQEVNMPAQSYKTTVEPYVNSNGLSKSSSIFVNGTTPNYFLGNVSIGTHDAQGYKLAVAGNMIAESVKVKLQGTWPDFVFSKNYQLPTLAATAKYIKENGHLPGVPSAAEVKTKGLDVEEMNAKLLQKIEELTLHLIEKDKELINERERINKLEMAIKSILSK